MKRLLTLTGLVGLAFVASKAYLPEFSSAAGQSTWSLGFLLLAAFTVGEILATFRLPRITGYLLTGLAFGPYLLNFISAESVKNLSVIDSLALTFIALSAGGELHWKEIRENKRIIGWAIVGLMSVVFLGSSLLFLASSKLFAFTRDLDFRSLIVMAAVLGAIATARSPASAIAIIKETRARGSFTEIVLGVTVAMDILAIVFFALVVSVGQAVLSASGFEPAFLVGLGLEITISLVLGTTLGFLLAAWLARVDGYHLITIFTFAVLVTEASHFVSQQLESGFQVKFHLEPMLICIATGFVVRNFSAQGKRFLAVMEEGGLMVYTLFFALAGAALDLDVLRSTWALALVLVVIRGVSIQLGAWAGMRLSNAPKRFRKLFGMAFITQAGVSLGLAKAVEMRFPEWGPTVATLAVATISLNQIIGPVLFKQALWLANETGEQRED